MDRIGIETRTHGKRQGRWFIVGWYPSGSSLSHAPARSSPVHSLEVPDAESSHASSSLREGRPDELIPPTQTPGR
jgi:hypothetical protein